MKRDAEIEKIITRSLSAAEIMDLTGHNKSGLYQILNRLIRENKIEKQGLRYTPVGYSNKPIANGRSEFFCADPFGLSGLQNNRGLQLKLRKMQTKNSRYGTMQGVAAADQGLNFRQIRGA
jgi:hypothetical protein